MVDGEVAMRGKADVDLIKPLKVRVADELTRWLRHGDRNEIFGWNVMYAGR